VERLSCFLCGREDVRELPDLIRPGVVCPTCGQYAITIHLQHSGLIAQQANRRHLLSAATRQASDAGKPLTLTIENISSLVDSVSSLAAPLGSLNRTLLLLSKKQQRADAFVELDYEADYPLVFAHDGNEFQYFSRTLVDQGLVEATRPLGEFSDAAQGIRLTPTGWQRVLELEKAQRDSDQAFVAMWFDKSLDEVWEEGFKPALKATGFHPYRVDLDEHNDKIDDRIVAEIRRSGLLVADFTGHRGGVYFEAGFAMGLGIHVIWTCRESDIAAAHFDTRQYNHVVWKDPADLQSKLVQRIAASIPGRKLPPDNTR
jgi:hypothetical protein